MPITRLVKDSLKSFTSITEVREDKIVEAGAGSKLFCDQAALELDKIHNLEDAMAIAKRSGADSFQSFTMAGFQFQLRTDDTQPVVSTDEVNKFFTFFSKGNAETLSKVKE